MTTDDRTIDELIARLQARALRAEADAAAIGIFIAHVAANFRKHDSGVMLNTAMMHEIADRMEAHLPVNNPGAALLAVAEAAEALVEANGDAQYEALRRAVETWRGR